MIVDQVVADGRRTRLRRRLAVTSAVVILAASGSVVAGSILHSRTSGSGSVSIRPISSNEPPLTSSASANRSGVLENNVTRFSPPLDPGAALPPQAALNDAWRHATTTGASGARLVLAHLAAGPTPVAEDAWLVIFDGSCVPFLAPPRVIRSHGSQPAVHFSGQPCIPESFTVVIDARTGEFRFGFAAGPNSDPEKRLVSGYGARSRS
jgi:hypothetical protein